jgi:hypothetical protein
MEGGSIRPALSAGHDQQEANNSGLLLGSLSSIYIWMEKTIFQLCPAQGAGANLLLVKAS